MEERERESVPSELRPLFDSASVDLESDSDDDAGSGCVGYAMAATHTGVVVTGDDLRCAVRQGYHRVRTLTYLDPRSWRTSPSTPPAQSRGPAYLGVPAE